MLLTIFMGFAIFVCVCRGYWAYAGAGKNSRGTQLIMAFQDNQYLGGKILCLSIVFVF